MAPEPSEPESGADPAEQPPGGPLAGFDRAVEEADVVDRGVLAGEQEPTLGGAGQLAVGRGLTHAVVGVGAVHPAGPSAQWSS